MKLNSTSQPIETVIMTHNKVISIKELLEVNEIVQLARQIPLSHIGFSFNFTYDNPGIALKNTIIHDPTPFNQ